MKSMKRFAIESAVGTTIITIGLIGIHAIAISFIMEGLSTLEILGLSGLLTHGFLILSSLLSGLKAAKAMEEIEFTSISEEEFIKRINKLSESIKNLEESNIEDSYEDEDEK